MPQAAQLWVSMLVSVHTPPQTVCREGHAQTPPLHAAPEAHAFPHVPQFWTSFGMQSPLQFRSPAGH